MERPRVRNGVGVRTRVSLGSAPILPELLLRLLGFLSISLAAGLFSADMPFPVTLVALAPATVASAVVLHRGMVPPTDR